MEVALESFQTIPALPPSMEVALQSFQTIPALPPSMEVALQSFRTIPALPPSMEVAARPAGLTRKVVFAAFRTTSRRPDDRGDGFNVRLKAPEWMKGGSQPIKGPSPGRGRAPLAWYGRDCWSIVQLGFFATRPMPPPATPRLTQTGKFNEQRRFEFAGKRRLRVSERSPRKNRSYVIDVLAIDPKSRSTIRVPWNWLKLAVVGAAAALLGWLTLDGSAVTLTLMMSGAVSATGLTMTIRGTSNRKIFVSYHARLPLLDLKLNRPDARRFNRFIAYLEKWIASAHEECRLEKDQRVAGEVRTLRRLREAGVLEPAVYEEAKARLLEKFQESAP